VIICGLDEAGRGPLAGDVYAGAVILSDGVDIPGLNDSKKLSPKARALLYDIILEKAAAHSVAFASVGEIEELNILNASLLAMRRAVDALPLSPDMLLVDGNVCKGFGIPAKAVVGGDRLHPCIMAASILAKVRRDRAMEELDALYPAYGFAKHKGYGTPGHIRAVMEHGPCPAHRYSFLGRILREQV
jgi:ribonuclease HII